MRTRHAREIGAFRYSGHNDRPQPVSAPIELADDVAVSLGGSHHTRALKARLDAVQGVTLGDQTRVPRDDPAAVIFLSGAPVRVPAGWSAAVGHSRHGDSLYMRESSGRMHVLTVNADGQVRELQNLPADFLRDIEQSYLPRRTT